MYPTTSPCRGNDRLGPGGQGRTVRGYGLAGHVDHMEFALESRDELSNNKDSGWLVAAWIVGGVIACVVATWIYNVSTGVTH